MSSEAHDHAHEPEDTGAFVHNARHLLLPLAAVAATLTSLHAQGLAYTFGAVCLWLIAFLVTMAASMHDWSVCSLCSEPPAREATPEARARLARRTHSRWMRRVERWALVIVVVHALSPKPYMEPWWTAIPAAACYLAVATLFGRFAMTTTAHRRHHAECHLEWCRAGLSRPPRNTRKMRIAMWAGHHGVWLVAVLAPAVCALGLLSQDRVELQGGYAVALTLLAATVGDMVLVHTDQPCLRCARSLPSNGGETAERRHRWLRLFHVARPWLLGGALCAWAMSWVLAGQAGAKVLVCWAALSVVAWAALDRVHAPVKPWCPWCRDDDGDDTHTDVPDPSTNVPAPA